MTELINVCKNESMNDKIEQMDRSKNADTKSIIILNMAKKYVMLNLQPTIDDHEQKQQCKPILKLNHTS